MVWIFHGDGIHVLKQMGEGFFILIFLKAFGSKSLLVNISKNIDEY